MNNGVNKKPTYDLEERTTVFSEQIIMLCRLVEKTIVIQPLIEQLVRSATSVGANYSEANGASSKRDFTNKICICKKEAKETLYWLRLIGKSTSNSQVREKCRGMWREAHELVLIFSTISSKLKKAQSKISNSV